MSRRRLADQTLATATAPVGAHHLGRGSGLVDEHQARSHQGLPDRPSSIAAPAATSGRSCSAACRVFFEAHPVPLEEAIDRAVRGAHSTILQQPFHDLRQGQVRLLVNQLQQPRRMRLQRRAALAVAPPRADAPGLLMQLHPPDRRRRAHRKPFARRSPRAALGHGRNHPRAKIVRIGASSHGFLRITKCHGLTIEISRESPARSQSIHPDREML